MHGNKKLALFDHLVGTQEMAKRSIITP